MVKWKSEGQYFGSWLILSFSHQFLWPSSNSKLNLAPSLSPLLCLLLTTFTLSISSIAFVYIHLHVFIFHPLPTPYRNRSNLVGWETAVGIGGLGADGADFECRLRQRRRALQRFWIAYLCSHDQRYARLNEFNALNVTRFSDPNLNTNSKCVAGEFEKALQVAHEQVEAGAQVLDINMDEARHSHNSYWRRFAFIDIYISWYISLSFNFDHNLKFYSRASKWSSPISIFFGHIWTCVSWWGGGRFIILCIFWEAWSWWNFDSLRASVDSISRIFSWRQF